MTTEIRMNGLTEPDATYESYRALCAASVTSLLFGLLSVASLLSVVLCIIPALGIFMGVYALIQIRHRPLELAGQQMAWAGIVLSSVFLVAGIAVAILIYVTEVPEGYHRIYYTQLQPEEGRVGQKVPPLAEELNGQKVFIKGYVFPGQQRRGIKTFLLVRDKGDCCFGGNPKITDRIQVTLSDPERLTFSSRLHKLAGTFRLDEKPSRAIDAGGQVFYYLEDCQLR